MSTHQPLMERGDVRTYRGRTVAELIPQIRAELGDDAIILREREGLTGGVGGFFAQRCVEIDAQAAPRLSIYADDDELDFDDLEPAPELALVSSEPAPVAPATPATPAWAEIAAAAPEPAPLPEPAPAPAPVAAPAAVEPAAPLFDEATFAARLEQATSHTAEADPDYIAFDELAPEPEPEAVAEPEPAADPEPEPSPFIATPLEVPIAIDPPPAAPAAEVMQSRPAYRALGDAPPMAAAPAPAAPVRRRGGGWMPTAERMVKAALAARIPAGPHPTPPAGPVSPEPEPAPVPHAAAQAAAPAAGPAPEPAPAPVAPAPVAPPAPMGPTATDELQRRLLTAGLSRTRAQQLIAAALEVCELDEDLPDAVREELVAALPDPGKLPLTGGAIAIVGAGGAGKTRAVAALAIACARERGIPVTVARLGTPERATELAELVRDQAVDVIPSMRTQATVRAVQSARERGLVILDTPAASPGDGSTVDVLGEALAQFHLDGIYLAVPATFTARAAGRLTEGFAPLGLRGLVATHTDEVDQLGVVAELSMQTGLAVSHIHAGTEVTTAIQPISPDQLTEALLP